MNKLITIEDENNWTLKRLCLLCSRGYVLNSEDLVFCGWNPLPYTGSYLVSQTAIDIIRQRIAEENAAWERGEM